MVIAAMTIRKRDVLRHLPLLSRFLRRLEGVEAENRRLDSFLWDLSVADISVATEPYAGKEDTGGLPVPPAALRHLVSGTDDVEWFLRGGALGAGTVIETLRGNGIDVDAPAVLDFGCGCGRVLRHLMGRPGWRLHGADRNLLAIAWCRKNLPFAAFDVAAAAPPLPYSDGAFDLVYAFSVFTHLTFEMQAAWIAEARRVLKDGGHLLLSLHGDSYAARLPSREKAEYRRGRAVVLEDDVAGSNRCNAFHPETYVRQTLADGFEVVDFRPRGALGNPSQDLYLLKKLLPA
jgi:SAM-dependent methyltransferase